MLIDFSTGRSVFLGRAMIESFNVTVLLLPLVPRVQVLAVLPAIIDEALGKPDEKDQNGQQG